MEEEIKIVVLGKIDKDIIVILNFFLIFKKTLELFI